MERAVFFSWNEHIARNKGALLLSVRAFRSSQQMHHQAEDTIVQNHHAPNITDHQYRENRVETSEYAAQLVD